MGRSNREVGGYRGRRTVTDILKLIAIVLAVLVVLAVAAVLYLQRYLVYTDNGVELDLPPFLQMLRGKQNGTSSGGNPSQLEPGDLSIDIQPVGDQSEPQGNGEKETPGFALALTVRDVTDGSAAGKLEEAGAEALILEVKDRSGQLAWQSGQAPASRAQVNGTQRDTDALRQWNQGEVYTIARMRCFRDDSVPYFHNPMALRQGNGNWRDELGLRWLSPAQDRSRAYIAALCGELAELGFDEIVLEDFSFPVRGKLDRINRGESYDPTRFTAVLEEFLTQVQQAVEPYGTKISLRVDSAVLAEGGADSGVTAQLLDRFACRVWIGGEERQLLPDLSGAEERTVEIVNEAGEDREFFQAVLPEQ